MPETPSAATLVLDVEGWPGHRAGQHVDLRLTAEDGYTAQRSYSIASAPEESRLAVTVERLDDGEVSPYLVGEARPGDEMEVRGPVGGWFTWDVAQGGPLLLVAGGSGLVPLMAMLRHRRLAGQRRAVPAAALRAAPGGRPLRRRAGDDRRRGRDHLHARGAGGLDGLHGARRPRHARPRWPGRRPSARGSSCAGRPGFVEAVADDLVALGHPPDRIRTERFGATGE